MKTEVETAHQNPPNRLMPLYIPARLYQALLLPLDAGNAFRRAWKQTIQGQLSLDPGHRWLDLSQVLSLIHI